MIRNALIASTAAALLALGGPALSQEKSAGDATPSSGGTGASVGGSSQSGGMTDTPHRPGTFTGMGPTGSAKRGAAAGDTTGQRLDFSALDKDANGQVSRGEWDSYFKGAAADRSR